jgi:hypothetical protein
MDVIYQGLPFRNSHVKYPELVRLYFVVIRRQGIAHLQLTSRDNRVLLQVIYFLNTAFLNSG